jgi:L-malate glycosyltransferase
MKVLLIQPSNTIAGAELSALQVLEGLTRTFDVTCHVALPPPESSLYASLLKKTCSGIITLPLITWHSPKASARKLSFKSTLYKLYKGKPFSSVWKLIRYVRTHAIDIIYSNSGLCPVGGIVSRLTGIPHVWHIREKMGSGSEFPFYWSDEFSRKLFQNWCDFIICNSGFTAGFFNGEIKKLKVILNGIDTQEFSREDAIARGRELRKNLGFHDQLPVIGMVGSIFSSWKEHIGFMQAAKILKDNKVKAYYVIFGGSRNPGQSVYANTVFQAMVDLGLQGDVKFVDTQTDIPAMINSMDIMMHPTSQEGSGRIIMEAMAAGKPIVGVDAGGVGELIRNGENGLSVPAKRPDLLAKAVMEMLENETMKSRIEKQALLHAQQNYELARTQAEIYEIFEQVLHGVKR